MSASSHPRMRHTLATRCQARRRRPPITGALADACRRHTKTKPLRDADADADAMIVLRDIAISACNPARFSRRQGTCSPAITAPPRSAPVGAVRIDPAGQRDSAPYLGEARLPPSELDLCHGVSHDNNAGAFGDNWDAYRGRTERTAEETRHRSRRRSGVMPRSGRTRQDVADSGGTLPCRPDEGDLRRFPDAHRSPGRAADRAPVAAWGAGQHADHGHLRQRREGRTQRRNESG